MSYEDYLDKLLWQKLIRNAQYWQWHKTKDVELKATLEKKYKVLGLQLGVDPEGAPFWSCNPSPLKILSEGFADKVLFEIDLDKFKYSSDKGTILKEIEDKLKFDIKLRKGIPNTILQDRPEKTFDRDLEILAFWEELPNRPLKEFADKFDISVDTAQKALSRIYELIFEKKYQQKVRPPSSSTLCDACSPEKKSKCERPCRALKEELPSEIIAGSSRIEIAESVYKKNEDDDREYGDGSEYEKWKKSREP